MSGIRFSGLASGLDTESMVKELMKAHTMKVDKVKKEKTKLEWTKDIWKEMNTKLYDFYRKDVFELKLSGKFMQNKASISDGSYISVKTSSSSIRGTHNFKVTQLAENAYMNVDLNTIVDLDDKVDADTTITINLGGQEKTIQLKKDDDVDVFIEKINKLYESVPKDSELPKVQAIKENGQVKIINLDTGNESEVKLSSNNSDGKNFLKNIGVLAKHTSISADSTFTLSDGTNSKEIELKEGEGIDGLINKINTAGLDIKANYDKYNDIIFINNTKTGEKSNIEFSDFKGESKTFLEDIGFMTSTVNKGKDAVYEYNGVSLKSSSNEVNVNGMTVTLKKAQKGSAIEPINITITQNTDEIYKSVKDFILKYNELVMDINEKLDAESAKGYEPLTQEEKKGMSEDDIKLWEKKIKDSLLRRNDTLRGLSDSMRGILTISMGVDKSKLDDGFNYLSDLGIITSKENYDEGGLLHIQGDEDDTEYSLSENKLKKAIEEDPEKVADLLNRIGSTLYEQMQEDMKSSEISSAMTFYNDKVMDDKIDDYDDRIYELEQKLSDYEDRYYKQFAAMEQAMQQMNSQGAYLQSMLGGGGTQ